MHITDCWKGERCVWQMKTRLWDCLCVRVGQRDTRSQPLFPLSLTATNSTSFAGSLNTPVSFRLLPSQQYTGKWSLLIWRDPFHWTFSNKFHFLWIVLAHTLKQNAKEKDGSKKEGWKAEITPERDPFWQRNETVSWLGMQLEYGAIHFSIEHGFLISFYVESRNAIDVNESRNFALSVTFASHFNDFQCVVTAPKWNACWKLGTVLSSTEVFLRLDWQWW